MTTFNNGPLTNEQLEKQGYVDWADSITQINLALRTLQETLVIKNTVRTAEAFNRLESNVAHLKKFLELREVLECPKVQIPDTTNVSSEG